MYIARHRLRSAHWAFALLLAATCLLPAHAARLALVIGNKDYAASPLKNPLNDAEAMAAALGTGNGGLGFKVTLVRNLRRDDIGRTVEAFANTIRPGDDVVVFYAGHGLQVKGVNYLPAVDARIQVESDVALNSLNLNDLLQRLDEAKAGVRLLLIDACRDNPYSRGFRSSARGLARVEGAPSGTLMHFATRPGSVADDGQGNNGLYTSELLKHLRTPGLPVESMLKRVASGVRQASSGSQQPWTEGALDGEFFFAGAASAVAGSVPPQSLPLAAAVSVRPADSSGRPVEVIAPLELYSTYLTDSAPLTRAGLSPEMAKFVLDRVHESSSAWPQGLRTFEARWAFDRRNLNLLKSFQATLVADLGEKVVLRVSARDNQGLPVDVRPVEDFFMVFGKSGVKY